MQLFTEQTKFKIEWAEGYEDETSAYVGKELSLYEFLYIITKRNHEVALQNLADGSYGCYDKHKVFVKYDDKSEWEVYDRLDLGNEYDWKCIFADFEQALSKILEWKAWSEMIRDGKAEWESRNA